MSQIDFVGMVTFSVEYEQTDRNGRPVRDSMYPYYTHIVQKVGSNHHLIKNTGDAHYTLRSTDHLTPFNWYENEQMAREAYEKRKKEDLGQDN